VIEQKMLERDLSPKALKSAVYKETAQSPLTLYSFSAAALSAFYLLLIGSNPFVIGGLAVGGAFSLGSWVWNSFVRGDVRAAAIIKKYREQMENERNEAIKHLNEDLDALGDNEAIKQISLFRQKFSNFTHILGRKFNKEEFTYNRYLSIAEQVYLGGLANLEKASIALRSISAIDESHIKKQLKQLSSDEEARESLNTRLNLLKEQKEAAKALKKQNEIAMTQLDAISARLAGIDTSQRSSKVDLDDAMEELKYLIASAEKYSNQN